jgi:2-methylcitrate dehydratase PrpD
MSVSGEVAAFVSKSSWGDVPPEVVEVAIDHVVDTVGVMLAGAWEPAPRLVAEVYGLATGEATVVGRSEPASPAVAALVNGVAGHALDYDDTQLSTSPEAVYGLLTHPSTPALAAALALAEEGDASGADLLLGYLVGVEVACRLADAANPRHYREGFHSTGTIGTLGAAMAASRVLNLDKNQTQTCLGIAASMASGLRENFGTMTKPLHAGRAAHNGVLSALLAREGFTASNHVLEAKRGFFRAAAGGFDPTKISGLLGSPFFLASPGVSIKPYPSGSLAHPAMDVTLQLARSADLDAEEVESVTVGTNANVPNALIYDQPKSGLEGKFSLQYCVATCILRRRAGIEDFTDKAVRDPRAQAFLPLIRVEVDPTLEMLGYQHVRTKVRISTKDGRLLEGQADAARGYPDKPLSEAELKEKFLECSQKPLGERAQDLYVALRSLPQADNVRSVFSVIRAARATVDATEKAGG